MITFLEQTDHWENTEVELAAWGVSLWFAQPEKHLELSAQIDSLHGDH